MKLKFFFKLILGMLTFLTFANAENISTNSSIKNSITSVSKNIVVTNNNFKKNNALDFLKEKLSYQEKVIKNDNNKYINIVFNYQTGYKEKISKVLSLLNKLQLNNKNCKFSLDNLKQVNQTYILNEKFNCVYNKQNILNINKLNNLLSTDTNYNKIFNKNFQNFENQINHFFNVLFKK